MSLHDAVAKYVENGDTLAIGGFTTNRKPYAAVSEILRQGQKDFIVYAGPGGGEVDMLIGEGRVAAYINCYTANSGYTNVSRRFRAAIEQGKLTYEDYSQDVLMLMLHASSLGLPFLPVRLMQGSGLMKFWGISEEKRKTMPKIEDLKCAEIENPMVPGQKVVAVPVPRIDTAIIHVQQASPDGTCIICGDEFHDIDIAIAARKTIVTCEEIVSDEFIRRDPTKTRIFGECVQAVVKAPYGAWPSQCYAYYDDDDAGLKEYDKASKYQDAEDAVKQHMSALQKAFFREKRGSRNAPYTSNAQELGNVKVENLINHAIKQTERYRVLKAAGASDEEIRNSFNTPREMNVFSYDGVVDTVMTPRDSLLWQKHFLRTGFMSMDPRNGHVKAYVGGPNFTFFQYDMASTGRRQIGSTIKPFLYTYAMEEGFTPCDMLSNTQPVFTDESGRLWAPRNSGSARVGEMVDLRWALTNSNNWISARLMAQLSPTTLVRNMHNFGITNHIDPVMSLCLGSCEVSIKEMVGAYTAYANNGMRAAPLFVTAIADSNGNIISEFNTTHTEVISEKAYAKILSMLLNVVDGGTGNRVRRAPYNITAQMGGKTGTTNYNADGWFMGFTPELVSGVWVGGDERYIHFNNMANGQGAAMALPIYGLYMSKVYADPSLPYSQNATFDVDFSSLCDKEFWDAAPESDGPEESIADVFD